MRTVYDDVIEKVFKIDKEGRTIFFPLGFFGLKKTGYILTTEEKKEEIKRIYGFYSSMLFLIFISSFAFTRHLILFIILFVLLLVLHFMWLRFKINKAVEGLQTSDLTIQTQNEQETMSVGVIALAAMFMAAFSIFVFVYSIIWAGAKGIVISAIVILSMLLATIIFSYVLNVKKKNNDSSKKE